MSTIKCWLLCMAIGVAAGSECGICMHGRCLGPTPLRVNSEDVTAEAGSPFAVDMENNILYFVKDGLQAINLDDNTKNHIQTSRPNDNPAILTVDQVFGDVYYSYDKGGSRQVYKYQRKSNNNEDIKQRTSRVIRANNGTLYTAGLITGLSIISGSTKTSIDTFKKNKVWMVIFDKKGNMYARGTNKVYKVKPNEDKKVLRSSSYYLKSDRDGNIYLVDNAKNLIHRVDLETEELSLVGAFGAKYHDYIRLFKFDKFNNIIAQFPNTRTFTHFKDTSQRCKIIDPENTPYTSKTEANPNTAVIEVITDVTENASKVQEISKPVTDNSDNPHFGD